MFVRPLFFIIIKYFSFKIIARFICLNQKFLISVMAFVSLLFVLYSPPTFSLIISRFASLIMNQA
jgi:hypothetical protein